MRNRREMLARRDGLAIVRRRLDIVTDELALDRERMRLWSLVHARVGRRGWRRQVRPGACPRGPTAC
ncbi:MAG: hypothetical protein F9K40_00615 [Kofleriaceae bacterium]|nr:MAG: hypothetical protein F9K40_00615 [Kofleriaceae bacterium]